MLGPSDSGKTSLLACINNKFEKLNSKNFIDLKNIYENLKTEANKKSANFGINLINKTQNLNEYIFNLKLNSGSVQAKFYDFPGNWIDPNDDSQSENFNKLINILQASNVILITVNTPFLIESKGKFKDNAKIIEIEYLLKRSLENIKQNKLFVIVPIKCEKYIRSDKENLYNIIRDSFSETFKLCDNPVYKNKLDIKIIPALTAGNVYFSRFENGKEIFTKNNNLGFSLNIDQLLDFILEQFKFKNNFSGASGYSDKLNKINKLNNSREDYFKLNNSNKFISNNEYTIAIMGATGAGKTVYLASYFKMATQDAASKYPVTIQTQEAAKTIYNSINTLFVEGKTVIGTPNSQEMNFTASGVFNSDMHIKMKDMKGSDTQDIDKWKKEINEILNNASGAIFFISGEDLIHHPENIGTDNMVFANAIQKLRNKNKDVPVWFVITKADTIPNVSVKELEKNIAALLKRASDKTRSSSFLGRFFSKGSHVKIYKTQSMGVWTSPNVPPKNNLNPVNVVEPMDELFEAMKKSHKNYLKIWTYIILTGTLIGSCLAYYLLIYSPDHLLWHLNMNKFEKSLEEKDYIKASEYLNNFNSPSYFGLYLKNLRADNQKFLIAFPELEKNLFAELSKRLSLINFNILPEITRDFLINKNLVNLYLDNKFFEENYPEHYNKIKNSEWYFLAGTDFNYIPDKNTNPDQIIQALELCLNKNYKTPDSWRSMEISKMENILRSWINYLNDDVPSFELDVYINKAENLINNPFMPENLKKILLDQESKWNNLKSDNSRRIAEEWIEEAVKLPFDEAVRKLDSYMSMSEISQAAKDRIKKANDDLFLNEAENFISNLNSNTEDSINKLLAYLRKNNLPNAVKNRINREINILRRNLVDEFISKAESENLEDGIIELNSYLKDKNNFNFTDSEIERFEDSIKELEQKLIVKWLDEVSKIEIEDTISALEKYIDKSPSQNITERIKREINNLYNEIMNNALYNYEDDPNKLRGLFTRLSKGNNMPSQVQEVLQAQIKAAENKVKDDNLKNILQKLSGSNSFEDLALNLRESYNFADNNNSIQTQILSSAQKILRNEINNINIKLNDYSRSGDFSDARKLIDSRYNFLSNQISSILSGRNKNSLLNQLNSARDNLIENVSSSHFNICRSNFENNRASNTGIQKSINELTDFINTWPNNEKSEQALRALNYLKVIQNGIPGYFELSSGDFTRENKLNDTPDIYVKISGGINLTTKEFTDQVKPNFNYGAKIIWTTNFQSLKIIAYDAELIGSDREVFNLNINCSGWNGWRNLTGLKTSKGNSIYINFIPDGSIPLCPGEAGSLWIAVCTAGCNL